MSAWIGWFAIAQASPALWHVQSGASELYLFGSFHALPRGTTWRSPAVDAALARADQIVLESDVAPDTAEEIQALAAAATLPDGGRWDTSLDEDRRERLFERLVDLGLTPGVLVHMRPWIVSATVSEPLLTEAGFHSGFGVEMQLIALARERSVPMGALETVDSVAAIFEHIPLTTQVAWIEEAARGARRSVAGTRRLMRWWEAGNVDAIGRVLEREKGASAEFSTLLLDRRNEAWMAPIGALLEAPGVHFVAVGAAHLAGEGSVVRLLEAEGYTVERVQ